jgi:CheY-like chemotaxis protein
MTGVWKLIGIAQLLVDHWRRDIKLPVLVARYRLGPGLGTEMVVRLPTQIHLETPHRPPAPPVSKLSQIRRKVLVVDDNKDAAQTLARLLKLNGHDTHQAYDGLEAVSAPERIQPDAVLIDLGLPKLNGFEVCRQIRQQPWGKTMLLVALTGWGQEEDRRRSEQTGFDRHLVKPVDLNELTQLLADCKINQG